MKRILIVEDNDAIREELQDILEMEGFFVFSAENGQIGIDIAKKELPSLIITDILMPYKNGFELFEEINGNQKTKGIPVIFLTANASKDALVKGLRMGAKDYIVKPVSSDDLVQAINNKLK